MPSERQTWGTGAERLAAEYLQNLGLHIIKCQFRTRLGEIDIIARDGDEWVFVEVKARRTRTYGIPEEAVTPWKIRKIMRAGYIFLAALPERRPLYRLDVIAIEYHDSKPPVLRHLRAVG